MREVKTRTVEHMQEKIDFEKENKDYLFLRKYRHPYPIYFIADAICKEIPEDLLKYQEIKKYIDRKLEMKRGCSYDAVVRIVWAAISYIHKNVPENIKESIREKIDG